MDFSFLLGAKADNLKADFRLKARNPRFIEPGCLLDLLDVFFGKQIESYEILPKERNRNKERGHTMVKDITKKLT